jgi:hypothetical protein
MSFCLLIGTPFLNRSNAFNFGPSRLSMRTQAGQLEERLLKDGWRVVDREQSPEWWADELWTIESTWTPVGQRLFVTFLVDPMHEGVRNQGEHVWAVGVTPTKPASASEVTQSVQIRNGWTSHLETLLGAVRRLRAQQTTL